MQILNVVNTVFELYYLSSVGYLLQCAQPNVRLRLLTTPRIAARLNPEMNSLYSDVQIMNFPYISQSMGLRTIHRRLRYDITNSLEFRRQLDQLDLNADIICISSFREYFANILCRYIGSGPRIIALRMADHECDRLCQVRKPFHSLYLNLLNRLFGVSTMEYRWHKNTALTHAYWYTQNPYHRTIYISDSGYAQSSSEFRLPPPFIALRKLYGLSGNGDFQQQPSIMVAGERTPLYEGWDAAAQSLYEKVFDFLRENFAKYELLFKPREGLTDVDKMQLNGFRIIPPNVPFEELCLRKIYSRVISVKSTASKVAAYYGQPAYVLYPMFNLPANLRKTLDAYLADMRGVIKVHDLNELLQESSSGLTFDVDDLSARYCEAVMGGEHLEI